MRIELSVGKNNQRIAILRKFHKLHTINIITAPEISFEKWVSKFFVSEKLEFQTSILKRTVPGTEWPNPVFKGGIKMATVIH